MPTRILLVEDNPGDAVIFREKLNASELDYQLVHAKRLSEGLEQVASDAFDILMVDLSLPDAQGMEAVDQLRHAAPDSPLIVLTGLDDARAAADAKQRGAVDYLVKWYVDSPSLARYVRYAIEQYRTRDAVPNPRPTSTPGTIVEVEGVTIAMGEDALDPEKGATDLTEDLPNRTDSVVPARTSSPSRAGRLAPRADVDSGDLMRQAAEAALAFVEESRRQSAWLADVVGTALDLDRGVEVQHELVDVLDMMNQVVRAHRDLAMSHGLPVRVSSQRKKVIAHTDKNLAKRALQRLVVDTIHDARHDGVKLSAEVEGDESVLTAQWHGVGGDRSAHAVLGRTLVEELAERAGGSSEHTTDATGAHTVTIRLPGRPEA